MTAPVAARFGPGATTTLVPRVPSVGPRAAATAKPRVGVVKFASCDGCQLTLLDLEDELLLIAERVDLVEFAEATSNRSGGPFDILFVEGSISTSDQAREIVALRAVSHRLVTIGACATSGGIQALRNWMDHDEVRASVYPEPAFVDSLAQSRPIADFVAVDDELRGCPISGGQLREYLAAVLTGRRPQLPDEAVCVECKRRGIICLAVTRGIDCLGPVTRTGCGALCPAYGRGCYGCFGPRERANVASLVTHLAADRPVPELAGIFAGFTSWAPAFRTAIDALGGPPGAGRVAGRDEPSASDA